MATIAVDAQLGKGLSSYAISRFGLNIGGWSHLANVLQDGRYLDARSDRLGGVEPGVHIRLPHTEPWVKRRRASLEVSQETYDSWEANLRAKITDAYAKSDILGFLFGIDDHEDGHWDCSALTINAIQHVRLLPYPLLSAKAHSIAPDVGFLLLEAIGFKLGPVIYNRL